MRVLRLRLENFRGFEKLDLSFEQHVTVLVGVNGSGKTTVLDALGLAVRAALQLSRIDLGAYRRAADANVSIAISVAKAGETHEFGWSEGEGASAVHPPGWIRTPPLPVFVYYSVARNAIDTTAGSTNPGHWEPERTWENTRQAHEVQRDALARTDSSTSAHHFDQFFHWFREREDLENEDRRENAEHRDFQLEAVRQAVESVLPGYQRPRVRRPRFDGQPASRVPELVIDKNDQTLTFSQLSTGERTLAALVADIARRAAIARPNAPPLMADGVVLIDEIDLHLHPKWQAEILPRLRRTFPNIQFIVATHSPIVLSRVETSCVRILENFAIVQPGAPTEGRDPNALLTEVFDVPLRPQEIQSEIGQISLLLDDEKLSEARSRLEKLSRRLGEGDADVTRLRSMLELLSA